MQPTTCPFCAAPLPANAAVCPRCKIQISGAAPQPAPTSAPALPPAFIPEPPRASQPQQSDEPAPPSSSPAPNLSPVVDAGTKTLSWIFAAVAVVILGAIGIYATTHSRDHKDDSYTPPPPETTSAPERVAGPDLQHLKNMPYILDIKMPDMDGQPTFDLKNGSGDSENGYHATLDTNHIFRGYFDADDHEAVLVVLNIQSPNHEPYCTQLVAVKHQSSDNNVIANRILGINVAVQKIEHVEDNHFKVELKSKNTQYSAKPITMDFMVTHSSIDPIKIDKDSDNTK